MSFLVLNLGYKQETPRLRGFENYRVFFALAAVRHLIRSGAVLPGGELRLLVDYREKIVALFLVAQFFGQACV